MRILNLFWLLVVGAAVLLGFYAITGGWAPGEAPALGIAFVALWSLWGLHLWSEHRHRSQLERDAALRHQRERRGF